MNCAMETMIKRPMASNELVSWNVNREQMIRPTDATNEAAMDLRLTDMRTKAAQAIKDRIRPSEIIEVKARGLTAPGAVFNSRSVSPGDQANADHQHTDNAHDDHSREQARVLRQGPIGSDVLRDCRSEHGSDHDDRHGNRNDRAKD